MLLQITTGLHPSLFVIARLIAIFYNERKIKMKNLNVESNPINFTKLADIPEVPYIDCDSVYYGAYTYFVPKSKAQLLELLNSPAFMRDFYHMTSYDDILILCADYDLERVEWDDWESDVDFYSINIFLGENSESYQPRFSLTLRHSHFSLQQNDVTDQDLEQVPLPLFKQLEKLGNHQMILINTEKDALDFEIDQHAYHLTALNMFNDQSSCIIETDHDFDIVSHHLLDEYNNRFELLAITKNDQGWDVSQIIVIGNYLVHYVVQPHTVYNQALYGKPVKDYCRIDDVSNINMIDYEDELQPNILTQGVKVPIELGEQNYFACDANLQFKVANYAKQDSWKITPTLNLLFKRHQAMEDQIILDQWLAQKLLTIMQKLSAKRYWVTRDAQCDSMLHVTFETDRITHPQQFVFHYHDAFNDQLVLMIDQMINSHRLSQVIIQQIKLIKQLILNEFNTANAQPIRQVDEITNQIKALIKEQYLTQINPYFDKTLKSASLKSQFDKQMQRLKVALHQCNQAMNQALDELDENKILSKYQKMFAYKIQPDDDDLQQSNADLEAYWNFVSYQIG